MLEYDLLKDEEEFEEGTIGNQFKFYELVAALRSVYQRLPNEYPTIWEYFPHYNGGGIPADKVGAFLEELKKVGKEKIAGYELISTNEDNNTFLLPDQFKLTQLTKKLYQVINEDGYNLVMDKCVFLEETKLKNSIADSIPYVQKGKNTNHFLEIRLEEPIIVFQSKSFMIQAIENLQLFIDKEDNTKRFLSFSEKNNYEIVEHVEFKAGSVNFEDFNYIYTNLFNVVTKAFTEGCTIKWN